MRVILYSQKITTETSNYIQICIDELLHYNATLFVLENLYEKSRNKINFPKKINVLKKISKVNKIDFLICFGGDGTMLKAAHLIGKLNIAITGINTGRLGFLANIPKQNISDLVNALHKKKFLISPRSLIKISTTPKLKKKSFHLIFQLIKMKLG